MLKCGWDVMCDRQAMMWGDDVSSFLRKKGERKKRSGEEMIGNHSFRGLLFLYHLSCVVFGSLFGY
jgi:hypothetical protein